MTNSPQLSRRDWFRLRVPHQNQMLDENKTPPQSTGANQAVRSTEPSGLASIEHPPNHDGMDLSQLPPMREATLSSEQVIALFADIEQLGTDILLMQREAGARRASGTQRADTKAKLALAQTALLNGSIPRLQIRYRWQDQQWIDTLKRQDDGFHIVRIAHQAA